jgi:hypothetical protein
MLSLETALNTKVKIPATLSTSDDILVAFHVAVDCPEIDWPLAETVLDRFSANYQRVLTLSSH